MTILLESSSKELLHGSEVYIRQLNPELKEDRKLARWLDAVSLEAINPFTGAKNPELAHERMTPRQIRKWMKDSDRNILRVIEIPGEDPDKKTTVGFVYMYRDVDDPDFMRRSQTCLAQTDTAPNTAVWEMNFFMIPKEEGGEVLDSVARQAVEKTFKEFQQIYPDETVVVMFADDEDITGTARDLQKAQRLSLDVQGKNRPSPRDILEDLVADSEKKNVVEQAFQDTRVLHQLGFSSLVDMLYSSRDKLRNWVYRKVLYSKR